MARPSGSGTAAAGHIHHHHHGALVSTFLQQHCAFFDQDGHGIIYPWETFDGFRQIGFNVFVSLVLALGWFPNPLLPIHLQNIHKAKQVCDSRTCNSKGRNSPVNFENVFSKHSRTKPNKLTLRELWNMTEDNGEAFNVLGWVANKMEWGTLFFLARDQHGFLSKEAIRRCYDGSLFEICAKLQKSAERKKEVACDNSCKN